MDLQLSGKTFVVTGASSGLGYASALALVEEGANVVISGRDGRRLGAARLQLGDQCVAVTADNGDPETPPRLIDTAKEAFGRVDGGVISVGGPAVGNVLQATDEEWLAAFNTVFLGALRLTRAIGDACDEGGSIALVLSRTVREPIENLAISNGLRPGLAMSITSLADAYAMKNVRINGMLPGRFDTERSVAVGGQDDVVGIPLARHGRPEEFGAMAAVLMSPVSSYMTGSMVTLDGGALRTN